VDNSSIEPHPPEKNVQFFWHTIMLQDSLSSLIHLGTFQFGIFVREFKVTHSYLNTEFKERKNIILYLVNAVSPE
jgi:hypothetical protein